MNELTGLKGIGPKATEKLNSLNIFSVTDLLEYYPRTYADKSKISNISNAIVGENIALKGIISNIRFKYMPYGRKLHISTATFRDEVGQIELTWFNMPYLKNVLKENSLIYIYGKIDKKGFFFNITNPEFSFNEKDFFTIQPIYPKNIKTTQYDIRKAVKSALSYTDTLITENLPQNLKDRYDLCDKSFAINNIHYPTSNESFHKARTRLVFEEFFIMQLSLSTLKQRIKEERTNMPIKVFSKAHDFLLKLPFVLTDSQNEAIKEIEADLLNGYPMNRLLHGDVGSGKTVIALFAVMSAFENGFQSAFMAPTEILTAQHYNTSVEFLKGFGIKTVLLTGSMKKSEKQVVLQQIAQGTVDFVIGTHAIIQDNVEFENLALCITDEQHRFGVAQRNLLTKKADKPHLLVMSATPIPRTLALILYGDLDVTLLKELPKNRKKVVTYALDESFRKRINNFIVETVKKDEQVFVVCPAIYENDDLDISNVINKHKQLTHDLPNVNIGMLHGELSSIEKSNVLNAFIENKIQVLVTTSIIEVGIDIPNATVMIIEDAQQFGLSQLHQLRGRVGRSDKQSYCVLFNQSQSDIAKKRMNVMVESNDGFYISEQDLILRGPGDFFGLKQHGLPDFKIANIYDDMDLLKLAQKAVKEEIIHIDYYKEQLDYGIDTISKASL